LRSQIKTRENKILKNETDLSAFQKEKSKQAWIQRKNVHPQRKADSFSQKGKRQKKTDSFIGTQGQSLILIFK
jgi:hypothetical protein